MATTTVKFPRRAALGRHGHVFGPNSVPLNEKMGRSALTIERHLDKGDATQERNLRAGKPSHCGDHPRLQGNPGAKGRYEMAGRRRKQRSDLDALVALIGPLDRRSPQAAEWFQPVLADGTEPLLTVSPTGPCVAGKPSRRSAGNSGSDRPSGDHGSSTLRTLARSGH